MIVNKNSKKEDIKDISTTNRIELLSHQFRSKTITKNYLWIVFFIKKFIEKLKKKTILSNILKLNPLHYNIISDKSTIPDKCYQYYTNYYESTKKQDFFSNRMKKNKLLNSIGDNIYTNTKLTFSRIYSKMNEYILVFEPDNPFRFAFDIFILFYTLITVCQIFLSFGFKLKKYDYPPSIYLLFNEMTPWIFLFEILLINNTAYYFKGSFEKMRIQIIKKYFKENFLLDVITLLPLILSDEITNSIQLLYTMRLFKIKPIFNRLEEYFHFKGRTEAIFHLFKLILNLLFLAHICACLWQYTALWEIENGIENNWLNKKKIGDENWRIRYVYSLYFAVVTMMTVGYGDITSDNYFEILINIIIIIYGCGVFAYTINDIGVIFKEMNQEEKYFKKKIKNISEFMKKRGFNKGLQIKIKRYLEYMYEESQNNFKDNFNISESLSQTLKDEYFHEMYGKILRSNKFFKLFSNELLNKLSSVFYEQTFAPDDQICNINENNDIMIYFILKGQINLFIKKSSNQMINLNLIKEGETIGELPFILGKPDIINIKCKSVTHLAFLKRSEFMEILSLFQEDKEKFFEIKDKIFFSSTHDFEYPCISCHKIGHSLLMCPLLHHIPNIPHIIKKYNFYEEQSRLEFDRKKCKYNVLKNYEKIQESANELLQKNKLDDDISILESELLNSSISCDVADEREFEDLPKRRNPYREKSINYKKRKSTKYTDKEQKSTKSILMDESAKLSSTYTNKKKEFIDETNQLSNNGTKNESKDNNENNTNFTNNKEFQLDIIKNYIYYFPESNFYVLQNKIRGGKRRKRLSRKSSPKKYSGFSKIMTNTRI